MKKNFLAVFVGLLISHPTVAQNKLLGMDDVVINARKSLAPATLEQLQWIGKTEMFSYIKTENNNATLVSGSTVNAGISELISIKVLNGYLKPLGLDTLAQFPKITWIDSETFRYDSKNKIISLNVKTGKISVLVEWPSAIGENPDYHESSNSVAYNADNNLYIKKGNDSISVTNDNDRAIVNGRIVHREEFGIHKGTFWSPSGKYLAYYRMDERMVTTYPILELNHKPAGDRLIRYPMAGDSSHQVTIGIFDIASRKTIFLKTGTPADQYLTNIAWSPDEKTIYVAVLNRDQNHLRLNRYNVTDGAFEATLFEEKEPKYVQPLHAMEFTPDGKTFIWQSRRDGYNHLYLYDLQGKLLRQLTKGSWEVIDFLGLDEKGNKAFFIANSEKPVNRDIWSVTLPTSKLTRMSNGDGVHKGKVSHSGKFLIDEFTGPGIPRNIRLSDEKGTLNRELINAENPLKNYKPVTTEIFTIRNPNGDELYCRMVKPANFDSTRKYPTIIYVYGGPGVQLITNNWLGGADLWYYYMAQRDFILFTVDNRGTANRGKDFEQSTFRKLGNLEMEDQIAGVKYLYTKNYVDKNRLGIYGWSYGGFMTTTMMTRQPEIFKAAVAGGPVIDWRYYEVMYTERYMDTPQENPDGYNESSLLNYTDKLKGKLLLIHGTSDDVVVWQHSLMYLKKAVDKNIQLDYFVYPGHVHNVTGRDRIHLLNKISQYFFDTLGS